MDKTPVVRGSCCFHGGRAASEPSRGSVCLLGIGFDGTACFRKGAAAGPAAIRAVSEDLESYSPLLDLDLSEVPPFFDLGDLRIPDASVEEQWQAIGAGFAELAAGIDASVRLLTIGGEHSVTFFPVTKYLSLFPDLVLLHLDAHADLRDGYQGFSFSHAAVMKRCVERFGPGHRLIQFGIRSGLREEFAWMRSRGSLVASADELLAALRALPRNNPVYLTLDLDFFDPAFLPGTGTPEPGGHDFSVFAAIAAELAAMNLVGCDVVELAPDIDPTGNSAVFAAKVVRELILALHGGSHAAG